MSKRSPEELADWDLEIEAEFQRVAGQTRTAGNQRRRKQRLIGCPIAFIADVCRLTRGRAAAMVALCIYRRTKVCNSQTVTLPADELAELGVDRHRKCEALAMLQQAGLIEAGKTVGQTAQVTLIWQPG